MPFTAARILEGLRAGASVEVDLLVHGDGGFAVLHDRRLADSTTGKGLVRNTSAAALRGIELCDAAGRPCGQRVLLLEDLAELLAGQAIPDSAVLQLDFKDDARILDRATVAAFAAAAGPVATHLILSCGDAEAVALLTDATPGLAVGYDPCHHGAVDRALESGRFDEFVRGAVTASPRATTIYLEIRLILAAADRGADLIGAFAATGREVDAYTFDGAAEPGMLPIVQRLMELGAAQLTVDDPDGLAALWTDPRPQD